MKGFPYPGKSPMKNKDLKKVVKELRGAVKAHGKQAKTIEKAIKNEGKKNCGCGMNPCKTYGIQESIVNEEEMEEEKERAETTATAAATAEEEEEEEETPEMTSFPTLRRTDESDIIIVTPWCVCVCVCVTSRFLCIFSRARF